MKCSKRAQKRKFLFCLAALVTFVLVANSACIETANEDVEEPRVVSQIESSETIDPPYIPPIPTLPYPGDTSEEVVEEIVVPEVSEKEVYVNFSDVEYIAKTVWGEARGCTSDEQEQVVWCILNRVDNPVFPNTVQGVVTASGQFHGYNAFHPVDETIEALVIDVLERWEAEKNGEEVYRALGKEYLYFHGDGKHNYFRIEY